MEDKQEVEALFRNGSVKIKHFLPQLETGSLALPEFQRNFVWDSGKTASLIGSILGRYPAGSVLTWRINDRPLAVRAVEGAPPLGDKLPHQVILDGQQRLTSLYRVLNGKTNEKYFLRLGQLLTDDGLSLRATPEIDWDRAVKPQKPSQAELRAWKKDSQKVPEHLTQDWQYKNLHFPLDGTDFDDWIDGLLETEFDAEQRKLRKKALRDLQKTFLSELSEYEFPVTELSASVPLTAVCTIFEKVNTSSKPLGPFEIATAKFYKNKVDLRALWAESLKAAPFRDARLPAGNGATFAIDPYLVLQIISALKCGSPQRKAVLNELEAEQVEQEWPGVVLALNEVLYHLRDRCGVVHSVLMPYTAILVPLVGAWLVRKELAGVARSNALEKINNFFWASVFTRNYDQGAASQAEKDFKELRLYVAEDSPKVLGQLNWTKPTSSLPTPEVLTSERPLRADELLAATRKATALLKGLMALTAMNGALDFHNGEALVPSTYESEETNFHHIFPQDLFKKNQIDSSGFSKDAILNFALINKKTNIRIHASRPSVYVGVMREEQHNADAILSSHLITPDILVEDDYKAFLLDRLSLVVSAIETATGRKVQPLGDEEIDQAPIGGADDDEDEDVV